VNVKNPLELYPGGIDTAVDNFDDAWDYAMNYPFSSLPDIGGERDSPIVDTETADQLFQSPQEFKRFAYEQMNQYRHFLNEVDVNSLE